MGQETLTGLSTTYHTNGTVCNSKNEEHAKATQEITDYDQGVSHPLAKKI